MTGPCYVRTDDIKAAVRGQEEQILGALGIEWRSGRPHIRCPYPTHGGEADWRWDERKAKAYCTCSSGDSIIDVVAKVEGLPFDEAKLRVAELIGRRDLIHEPVNGKPIKLRPATDYLAPPDNLRDDGLVVAYLAHRLDVEPDQMPLPVTPYAGWKSLPYYDPPAPGGQKPVKVGDYPAATFGTLGADGKTHCMRIWLAPGGAGKADLGNGPDGRPRDPKKSARATEGDNTGGRAVLWGAYETAPWTILCEGIETGAAIAFAFRQETEAGDLAVAAAISAGGLEAFRSWPGTSRITVAADRDEGEKPDGREPSRRGEKAAREFGLRHHEQIEVSIAMPGAPGEGADWLDVLRRDGVDAVRDGILGAEPFAPPDQDDGTADGGFVSFGPLTMGSKGLYHDAGGATGQTWLCGPIEVLGATRDEDGEAWGTLLRWRDRDGRIHVWAMPQTLVHVEGGELCRMLADRGLRILPGTRASNLIRTYFGLVEPKRHIRCTGRIGWAPKPFKGD